MSIGGIWGLPASKPRAVSPIHLVFLAKKSSQQEKSKKCKNRVSPLARERRCHRSSRCERSIGVGWVVYKVEANVPSCAKDIWEISRPFLMSIGGTWGLPALKSRAVSPIHLAFLAKKIVNMERARNTKIAFPRSHANGVATARLGVRDP